MKSSGYLFALICGLTLGTSAQSADILITDFEGKDYAGWKVEGKAFGDRPAIANVRPSNKVKGYIGKGLVNTYLGGDKPIGKLTSPAFKIERDRINFLIGAGRHKDQTCINLVVDQKRVRTAVGPAKKTSYYQV